MSGLAKVVGIIIIGGHGAGTNSSLSSWLEAFKREEGRGKRDTFG